MPEPPFKRRFASSASASHVAVRPYAAVECRDGAGPSDDSLSPGRGRLADLRPHLYCSVLGTCLSTAALRKLMARFIDVDGMSDIALHREAVRLAGEDAHISKALHKALDKRHDAVVQRFSHASDPNDLLALWEETLRQGEIPGAYWAVLTHHSLTPELRQRAFGEVHMLSHLVGAANRADIRRLVALEKDNADLRDKLDRQQARAQQLLEERDAASAQLHRHALADAERQWQEMADPEPAVDTVALTSNMALQTARRERAESEASAALVEVKRLQDELERLRRHAAFLSSELSAAEVQLREMNTAGSDTPKVLSSRLQGQRILYVGGRPSSTPAIRDLVLRHGGEFQRHDGGFEDRKGLLESAVAWAQLVLFPVDCIDHDSAGRLKRLCMKQGTPYVPLRSASVASFAAAIADRGNAASSGDETDRPTSCLRHG